MYGSNLGLQNNLDFFLSNINYRAIWRPFAENESFMIIRNSDTKAELTIGEGIEIARNIKSTYAEQYWQAMASTNTFSAPSWILVLFQFFLIFNLY